MTKIKFLKQEICKWKRRGAMISKTPKSNIRWCDHLGSNALDWHLVGAEHYAESG